MYLFSNSIMDKISGIWPTFSIYCIALKAFLHFVYTEKKNLLVKNEYFDMPNLLLRSIKNKLFVKAYKTQKDLMDIGIST